MSQEIFLFISCTYTHTHTHTHTHIYIYIYIRKVKFVTVVEGDPKAPFSIATTPRCFGKSATPFLGLLHLTLDTHLVMLSVKQGGIKYHLSELLNNGSS